MSPQANKGNIFINKKAKYQIVGFLEVIHRVEVIKRFRNSDWGRSDGRSRGQPSSPRLWRTARRVGVGRVEIEIERKRVQTSQAETQLRPVVEVAETRVGSVTGGGRSFRKAVLFVGDDRSRGRRSPQLEDGRDEDGLVGAGLDRYSFGMQVLEQELLLHFPPF